MTEAETIRLFVDPHYAELRPVVTACIVELLTMAGWRVRVVDAPAAADFTYDARHDASRPPQASVEAWRTVGESTPSRLNNVVHPSRSVVTSGNAEHSVDPILSSHFFLSGYAERASPTFPKIPIPGVEVEGWGIYSAPAVQSNVQALATYLKRSGLGEPARQWPRGKQWALCITHDCDQPFRYRPLGYLRDIRFALGQRRWTGAAGCLLKSAYSAACAPLFPDPFLGSWKKWMEVERRMQIRSAFFVGAWNRYMEQSDERDLGYSCDDPRIKRIVQSLAADGWQVGLHSGIEAWKHPRRFEREAQRFERAFGFAATGLRGHFWSLDPEDPEESLAMAHEHGGFSHDSSFGLDVVHGFRRGTCYPYRPYRRTTGESSGLWEIPPTIMDWALYQHGKSNEERISSLSDRIRSVRQWNGLAVLDWHEYTLSPGVMNNLGEAILPVIEEACADSSCWIATPEELTRWCATDRWTLQ